MTIELERRLRDKFSAAEAGPTTAEDRKLTDEVWAGLKGMIPEPDKPVPSPFRSDNKCLMAIPESAATN